MVRPNKEDYLTTNQYEYDNKLNEYYEELEKYVDYLESMYEAKWKLPEKLNKEANWTPLKGNTIITFNEDD